MKAENSAKNVDYFYQSMVKNGQENNDDLLRERKIDIGGGKAEIIFERIPNTPKNQMLMFLGVIKKATKSNVQAYYEQMGFSKIDAHSRVFEQITKNRSGGIRPQDIESTRLYKLGVLEPDARIEDYLSKST